MDNMTFAIYHNVPVVSILHLQDVADHRIRCHGLNEVEAGFLELDRVLSTILRNEEVE